MGTLLNYSYFNSEGRLISSGQKTLPDSLDWKSIDEKEVFIRHIGGMPQGTLLCLIQSQGEVKLIGDLGDSVGLQDIQSYKRKMETHEQHLEEACRELGIDRNRKPRNQ